jgi:poly-beta-1,6-N-acetyl-D-glucosamine N-deacetylase
MAPGEPGVAEAQRFRCAQLAGRVLGIPVFAGLLVVPGLALVKETLPYRVPVFPPPVVVLPANAAPLLRFSRFEKAVPVLLYRDVSTRQGKHTVPPTHLAEQLAMLRAAGFQSVSLAQLKTLVDGVPTRLPSRPILLVFSGGLATDWTTVDPILRLYGFDGVAFVPTGRTAERSPSYYLTNDEIRAMASSGRWEFGAEPYNGDSTVLTSGARVRSWLTHRALRPDGTLEPPGAWRARVAADLDRSRTVLGRIVRRPVDTFAYPFLVSQFPGGDQRIAGELDAVVGERFALAFDSGSGTNDAVVPTSPRFHLPTMLVSAADSGILLLRRIRGAIPVTLPANPSALPYRTGGGTCVRSGPAALTMTTGHFVRARIELNTDRWTDYQLDARIAGVSRDASAILVVRAGRAGDVEVVVGQGRVVVRERIRKRTITLAKLPSTMWASSGSQSDRATTVRTVQLRVLSDVLVVRIDGRVADPILLDQRLSAGGVGFGLVTRGRHTVTFSDLRLHPLGQPQSPASRQ